MSNLQIRIITAVCLGSLTLSASWMGGYVFTAYALLIGAALYHEWQTITRSCQTTITSILGWLFFCLIALLLLMKVSAIVLFVPVLAGAVMLSALSGHRAGWVAGGFVYAAVAPVVFVLIRDDAAFGFGSLVFLYAVVWGTDSAAYFSGRAIGGTKLVPKISPNKTWSGATGGAVAGIVCGMIIAFFLLDIHPMNVTLLALALTLSVASQIGDIGESWIKRRFDVKDSSKLLPGHGGFMDRLDGLVAASIVFYVIAAIFANMDAPALFSILSENSFTVQINCPRRWLVFLLACHKHP